MRAVSNARRCERHKEWINKTRVFCTSNRKEIYVNEHESAAVHKNSMCWSVELPLFPLQISREFIKIRALLHVHVQPWIIVPKAFFTRWFWLFLASFSHFLFSLSLFPSSHFPKRHKKNLSSDVCLVLLWVLCFVQKCKRTKYWSKTNAKHSICLKIQFKNGHFTIQPQERMNEHTHTTR